MAAAAEYVELNDDAGIPRPPPVVVTIEGSMWEEEREAERVDEEEQDENIEGGAHDVNMLTEEEHVQ